MNYKCIKIAVANQKGGVGKTTTAVNLATSLASIYKVLLIDLDPQGNASTSININIENRNPNIYHVMINECKISKAIKSTLVPNLDVVPSVVDLSAIEIELINHDKREYVLKNAIKEIEHKYDIILVDCPPSLGLLTVNALTMANSMIIPLQCEFFALEGLSHLLHTYELVKDNLNPDLEIEGIVLTMYDKRNRLTDYVEKDVRDYLGEWVFSSVIPRNVKLSEAPSHGKPAIIYDVNCNGSRAYLELTKELLERIKRFEIYERRKENVG